MTLPGVVVGRPRSGGSRLRIDASRCGGKGVCVRLAPSLFALDRFGYAYVLPDAQRGLAHDAALRILARDAAVRCPDGAIRLDPVAAPAPATTPTPPSLPASASAGEPLLGGPGGPEPTGPRRPGDGSPAARPAGPRLLVDARETRSQWSAGAVATPPVGTPGARLVDEVERAGLVGQGGGRFPVAVKWRSVGRGPAIVVANAAEREPGTVKDRTLLSRRPFAVLDGIVQTAGAVGADRAVIAIDAGHPDLLDHVAHAVAEATVAGLTGGLPIDVVGVPARYVAGEETALLAALAGADALPHVRPPHPTERGLHGRPTVVHNVETLVQIALIARHGADWFRAAGTATDPGTGVFSIAPFAAPASAAPAAHDGPAAGGAACAVDPVVVEAAFGTSVGDVLRSAGFGTDDLAAVVVGGWSGGILRPDQLDTPLEHAALAAVGAALGTKAIAVVPAGGCPVAVVHRITTYFAGESAGQCPSCVQGLPYVAGALRDLGRGGLDDLALDELHAFLRSLPGRGACALPDGAVRMVRSLFTNFADLVDRHRRTPCATCKEALG